MFTQIDNQVISRFNEAINALIEHNTLESLQSYCIEHNFNTDAVNATIANGDLTNFHFDWLTPLILDYGTSPLWLITGLGERFMPIYTPNENKS